MEKKNPFFFVATYCVAAGRHGAVGFVVYQSSFFFLDLNIEIAYGHGALITNDGLSECSKSYYGLYTRLQV